MMTNEMRDVCIEMMNAGFPPASCTGQWQDGGSYALFPSSDDIVLEISKIYPHIKIRRCADGYYESEPPDGKNWSVNLYGEGQNYFEWYESMWLALAHAYITTKTAFPSSD